MTTSRSFHPLLLPRKQSSVGSTNISPDMEYRSNWSPTMTHSVQRLRPGCLQPSGNFAIDEPTRITSSWTEKQRWQSKAERLLSKFCVTHEDMYRILFETRNTPPCNIGLSPVQCLYSRKTRNLMPESATLAHPVSQLRKQLPRSLNKRIADQQRYHDRVTRRLSELSPVYLVLSRIYHSFIYIFVYLFNQNRTSECDGREV